MSSVPGQDPDAVRVEEPPSSKVPCDPSLLWATQNVNLVRFGFYLIPEHPSPFRYRYREQVYQGGREDVTTNARSEAST